MLNTDQNTWQGQNYFSNPGNQFSGVFNGSGSGITGLTPASIIPGTFPAGSTYPSGTFSSPTFTGGGSFSGSYSGGTFTGGTYTTGSFSGTFTGITGSGNISGNFFGNFGNSGNLAAFYGSGTFGTPAVPALFYGSGTFGTSEVPGTFTGDGSALTGIPTLAGNQTWTGTNQFDDVIWANGAYPNGPATLSIGTTHDIQADGNFYSLGACQIANIYYGSSIQLDSNIDTNSFSGYIAAYGAYNAGGNTLSFQAANDIQVDGNILSLGFVAASGNIFTDGDFGGRGTYLTGIPAAAMDPTGTITGIIYLLADPSGIAELSFYNGILTGIAYSP